MSYRDGVERISTWATAKAAQSTRMVTAPYALRRAFSNTLHAFSLLATTTVFFLPALRTSTMFLVMDEGR